MITTNPQQPTLNLSTHRFKPYSLHQALVFQSRTNHYQKRCYKHIHHLSLIHKNKSFIKRTLMPKTLHSLSLAAVPPSKNNNLSIAIVKKLVKPYRKYLTNLKGYANHPEIQKFLPSLNNLRVNLTKESLRMLTFHSGLKKLHFTVFTERYAQMIAEKLLMKQKTPLSKSIANIKGLTTLAMRIVKQDAQAAWLLFEIISQSAHLDSLNGFSLELVQDSSPFPFQNLHEQKADIAKVLARLTHFSGNSTAWYYSIIASGKLDNLSVLRLHFTSNEIFQDLKDLLQFHNFPKLNNLSLNFKPHPSASEKDFFENFTLPSSLEILSLTLIGFMVSDSQSKNEFFKRLQKAKGVKTLNLEIIENNSALGAKFACLLIKCFDSLEILKCQNSKGPSFGLFGNKDNAPVPARPLDFQDFWTAVTPSKETLQSISVTFDEITFPVDVNLLKTEFPKLQKLELQHRVSLGAKLGRFCQKIPNLREITLQEVEFQDEERLRVFLDGMKEIPKGGNFALYLDVRNIQQGLLIDCLKKYIKDVKVKGRLRIYFTLAKAEPEQAFGEILKMVVEKGCFEPFKMVIGPDNLFSNTLIYVMKKDIIENKYNLNPN